MKIAIDARPLLQPVSGIGRYLSELLSRFPQYSDVECELLHEQSLPRALPGEASGKLLWQQWQLKSWLEVHTPDLFWSPRHHLPLIGCRKIPMILTIHDLVYRRHPHTMKKANWAMEKLLFAASVKRADHIITVSHATAEALQEDLHTPAAKISVIHSGYSITGTYPSVDLSVLGIVKPIILFVSSMEPRKNPARLLEAYLSLPAAVQAEYQLVFVGSAGWKSAAVLEKIRHQPASSVLYLGHVDDACLNALFKAATCFAFPSLYEGFGLPILEAMSKGVPVLTSTDPACMEVAGNAALIVDPLSTEAIQAGLCTLLENAPLREDLRTKAYLNLKRFSWDDAARAHVDVFGRFGFNGV
jgi:glycosyltransferase involved in cell wall biosynthesis